MTNKIEDWRRGILLSEAYWHFASPRLRKKLERTQRKSTARGLRIDPPDFATATASEISQFFLMSLKGPIDNLSEQIFVLDEMKQAVLIKLIVGAMVAYGFPVDDGIAANEPCQIPSVLFNAEFVYWAKSSLKGLGREFVSVRVVRGQRIRVRSAPTRATTIPTITPRKQGGRPSMKPAILEEITRLYTQGLDLASASSKKVGELVRKRVAARLGKSADDIDGLSVETIRRVHAEYKKQNHKG